MKSKGHSQHNNKVTIYLHELNLEYEHNATFLLITEVSSNGVPQKTHFYRIPDSYKDDRLLGQLHERYAKYCPN